MTSSEGFQQHFSIISKIVCCGCKMKKNVPFTLISFAVLKWDDCLSVQVPFELTVQIPVQLRLELELNWLDQNVNELEFELSRMYMKQTGVYNFRPLHNAYSLFKQLNVNFLLSSYLCTSFCSRSYWMTPFLKVVLVICHNFHKEEIISLVQTQSALANG